MLASSLLSVCVSKQAELLPRAEGGAALVIRKKTGPFKLKERKWQQREPERI